MSLDDYTYAEATQMYAEHGMEAWQHTSAILACIVSVNRDPKKGQRVLPSDYNPWLNGGKAKRGIKLTRENLSVMQGLCSNVQNPDAWVSQIHSPPAS